VGGAARGDRAALPECEPGGWPSRTSAGRPGLPDSSHSRRAASRPRAGVFDSGHFDGSGREDSVYDLRDLPCFELAKLPRVVGLDALEPMLETRIIAQIDKGRVGFDRVDVQ